jgi:undecaprenyl-diphosphatase
MAATTCLYAGLAILVIGHARGWWRYLFLIPAIVMPVVIALARLYRGEHHPTDILASLVFACLWLTAATMLIKPSEAGTSRDGGYYDPVHTQVSGNRALRERPAGHR